MITVPRTTPRPIAPQTWLIHNVAPTGPGYIAANSLVVRGAEPVVVDTGAPVHREQWLEQVFSLVETQDVRWIFLSHDDGDHTGGLLDVLERCPSATLVTNFFTVDRLRLEMPEVPLDRMRTRRLLRRRRPPDAADPAADLRRPHDPWPLRRAQRGHVGGGLVDSVAVDDAFDRVRGLAGQPRIMGRGAVELRTENYVLHPERSEGSSSLTTAHGLDDPSLRSG